MSFTIVRTNGTVLAIIPDGDLNTTSSPLFLPGRKYPGYGSVIDTNFVRTLENYAFTVPPQNALQGQLWYDTSTASGNITGTLKICPVDGESNAVNWYTILTSSSTTDIVAGNVTASGNVDANNFNAGNIVTANLVSTDYLTVNVQANIANANVTGNANLATVRTNAITTGSNTTPGNLTGVWSLNGTLTSNGNITALGFESDNYRYANGQLINFDAAAGNTGEIQFNTGGSLNTNPNLTFTTANSALSVGGNVTAANFTTTIGGIYTGNGSGLSAIAAANLTGNLSSAMQSNITQLGTLVNLIVSNNINTANIFATEVTATQLVGSLTTAVQPNITSVGTLSSLSVTGKVTAGQLQGDGGNISNIQGGNVSGAVAFATTANAVAGANVSGQVGNALIAGTVYTAAQPNITSLGTLTNLTVSGNIVAGNISGNIISGSNPIVTTGNANVGNLNTTGIVGGTGATLLANTLTTGGNTIAGAITGNWTLTAGSRLTATYADLAERYVADMHYESGTILTFGGDFEVSITSEADSTRVAGVVSTNPAYLMNAECEGEYVVELALIGRVPCKVIGPVIKGDLITTSEIAGFGKTNNEARTGTVIGKALENFNGPSPNGIIEVLVGRC